MIVTRVIFARESLARMPKAERSLFLLSGHAMNEINVLLNLILTSRKGAAPDPIITHVESGQNLIFFRLLIGKLHEAWELFRIRFQRNRALSEKYGPLLSPEALHARDALNTHFGRGSPLTAVRNKLSFHYRDDDDLIERSFQSAPPSEFWVFYLNERTRNSFYAASETAVMQSVFNLVTDGTPLGHGGEQKFSEFMATLLQIGTHLVVLFHAIAGAITEQNFTKEDFEAYEFNIPEGPLRASFTLPFYFDDSVPVPLID